MTPEFNSENITKIGPILSKLLQTNKVVYLLRHGVYTAEDDNGEIHVPKAKHYCPKH